MRGDTAGNRNEPTLGEATERSVTETNWGADTDRAQKGSPLGPGSLLFYFTYLLRPGRSRFPASRGEDPKPASRLPLLTRHPPRRLPRVTFLLDAVTSAVAARVSAPGTSTGLRARPARRPGRRRDSPA